jgi:predicted GNAT family acetyltransferase
LTKRLFSKTPLRKRDFKWYEEKVENQDLFVWEVNAEVVSMAAKARPTRHGIAVNYVYTPTPFRKKGYATSCVARVESALAGFGL